MTLAALRARLESLPARVNRAVAGSAPDVQAAAREAARTKRGNVPEFAGPPGAKRPRFVDMPIVAVASGSTCTVTAPDWTMRKIKAADIFAAVRSGVAEVLGAP